MNEEWRERPGFHGALYPMPSSSGEYERLNREIEELRPRVTLGSTLLYDYNRKLAPPHQLWMRRNGLGPR